MKIALVTPNWNEARDFFPVDSLRPPRSFPLEWGYLAQALRTVGDYINVKIFDEYMNRSCIPSSINMLRDYEPNIVIISTTPSYLFWRCPPTSLSLVRTYVREVRNAISQAKIILIGPHGTSEPKSTIRLTSTDWVFRGEVESGVVDAVRALLDGRTHRYLTDGSTESEIAPELPFGDQPINYLANAIKNSDPHTWSSDAKAMLEEYGGGFAMLETSRGCSFDCGYCFRCGFRKSFRSKPIEVVRAELEQLSNLGVSYVFLVDETFGLGKTHSMEVIEALRSHGIRFGIQTRPDLWTRDEIELLADSECCYVELGTESLTEAGINALGKYNDPMKVQYLTAEFKKLILHVGVNIVDVGNPDLELLAVSSAESEKDNEGDLPPAFIPYPNTEWGNKALNSAGGSKSWDDVTALHSVYVLMSRKGLVRTILRRSKWARKITRLMIAVLVKLPLNRFFFTVPRTRFEKRNYQDRADSPNIV